MPHNTIQNTEKSVLPNKLPLPSWIGQRLAKIVYKAKQALEGRTAPEIIDGLCFQAFEMLKMDLKAVSEELKGQLPKDFVHIAEKLNHCVLSQLEAASLIILEEESKDLIPSAIEEASRLKTQGLSEYEATKAAGKDLAKLKIEALIGILAGGENG